MTGRRMSPEVPHRVGVGALNWLVANREHFRPRSTSAGRAREALKPVGELAVIGAVLLREGVAGSRQSAQLDGLLDFAWRDLLKAGDVLAAMLRDEPLSPIPMEVYVPFRELGLRHAGIEEHLRVVSRTTSWRALEALPNRRLGMMRAAARADLPAYADVAEAARRTWLGHTPEPWTVEYNLAYTVTHTVFHLTDWGRCPAGLPPDLAEYLALWLPVWIDEWAELRHWDLLGELLIVDTCLPAPALDEEVWRHYAEAQSPTGAMPVQGAMPSGPPDEVFDLVHHPTIVAAFAATMATSHALAALNPAAP
ncbi:DUF6895 family protein [Actinokineospora sp. UTMC 2448]|uniref:DUF6895 family protein n=1 Tax=Actinokineospora sp. UTMC 2448 TaxID=2268449 RepID=UPI002164C216|nr:hypothetical protein [Actinokineospora sp. UTMC 2448]UVS78490.1 hypothetical protein Actkin_02223 [Actinokineospora sp. UTMC 2448]